MNVDECAAACQTINISAEIRLMNEAAVDQSAEDVFRVTGQKTVC